MATRPGGVLCFPTAAHESLARRVPPPTDFALRRPVDLLFLRASSGLGVARVSSDKLGRLASCVDVGMFVSPFLLCFWIAGLVTDDGRWFSGDCWRWSGRYSFNDPSAPWQWFHDARSCGHALGLLVNFDRWMEFRRRP
jgi:hypothetical protein